MAGELTNHSVEITAGTPTMQLKGTETGAGNFSVKEDGGDLEIFDEANNAALFSVAANQPMVVEIPIPVIFETPTGDLAADSTGNKFWSKTIIPSWQRSAAAAIEATWTASGTNSITRVRLIDVTETSEIAYVEAREGTDAKSSYVTVTAGHTFQVRVSVTQAGGSGDTTNCQKAIVYLREKFA